MGSRRTDHKSDQAFRTISEVSDDLEVPQHVLRFWETKFDQVQPMKRGGGRRYYRPEDVALLRSIRDRLYGDGYTIKGVQKLLREGQLQAGPPDGTAGEVGPHTLEQPGTEDWSDALNPSEAAEEAEPKAEPAMREGDRQVLRDLLDELLAVRERLRRAAE